ncbi:DUF2690 domain-containing protein [Micromonospora carbonacea]|uniref:DUF2690 domain-containing protein n=1 Tax=Micromonospora carbonacea TaxID=47853 RepID=A0A7H8XJ67_9ACTN|nr:DUF2690 domain-containing protein [Micromonospora carbonacea]MBB5827918.1 hypothetical protein [Micromonospora carbonacea]QLD24389.1 DUF2690 domain-containing protein [Micromonospora carbonacea]
MVDRTRARLGRVATATLSTAAILVAGATPAAAVSGITGQDPYSTGCYDNGWQWSSTGTPVYDGSRKVGTGYLRYSGGCVANWSEFRYEDASAYNDYSARPSAWEDGVSGTDQYSPNLWLNPVYSRMVDGRGAACAGAQVYRYPSGQWVSWTFFACA